MAFEPWDRFAFGLELIFLDHNVSWMWTTLSRMAAYVSTSNRHSGRDFEQRRRPSRRPRFSLLTLAPAARSIRLAQAALVVVVLDFSMADNPFFPTNRFAYLAFALAAGSLIDKRPRLATIGNLGVPFLLLFWWRIASMLWTYDDYGTRIQLTIQVAVFLVLVALAACEDSRHVLDAILVSGYAFFCSSLLAFVVDFSRSTAAEGVPGIHGWAGQNLRAHYSNRIWYV